MALRTTEKQFLVFKLSTVILNWDGCSAKKLKLIQRKIRYVHAFCSGSSAMTALIQRKIRNTDGHCSDFKSPKKR